MYILYLLDIPCDVITHREVQGQVGGAINMFFFKLFKLKTNHKA